ncbi:Pyruvate/Phosphoenolpyruvate kinase-like domain-containing protein [Diplogelasinospora grovesii]|uniref:Pyruvate/Phosphoenolpyruvate kinase-like domain-containing protein n=1 Tax=Diplogelasinospora grovesii TaxID=303347 RepID=A0AAN6NGS5_9PEZI|nr:Pyruvate/Phosphoenolpyruvate kinase-like domain-containing protein [Diplogelasinospora grovesii]
MALLTDSAVVKPQSSAPRLSYRVIIMISKHHRSASSGSDCRRRPEKRPLQIGDVIQTVGVVRGLVDKAVQASPEAAIAWVGVSFALEVLSNPLTEPGINRKGLSYVVSRMDWYWNLVDLLLDERSNAIRVHPVALVHFDQLKDAAAMREIARLTAGYDSKSDYFVDKLSHGLAALCAAVYPKPAVIRMSDFKTNEYAHLIGGAQFEPKEENPMIGFRGASRYYSPLYREGFALECRAIKRLREEIGLTNVVVMIPFCRTVNEAKKVYVMCEISSNVILAADFTEHFDGFSIGSNDLTQLTLGLDRDSGELADLFDEQDEAVKWMIARVISVARKKGCKIGLCGQAPSDHPEFAKFLVEAGINSISVIPDSFVAVKRHVIASERA